MNCRTHEHRHFERTLRTVARPLSTPGSGSVSHPSAGGPKKPSVALGLRAPIDGSRAFKMLGHSRRRDAHSPPDSREVGGRGKTRPLENQGRYLGVCVVPSRRSGALAAAGGLELGRGCWPPIGTFSRSRGVLPSPAFFRDVRVCVSVAPSAARGA